MVRRCFSDTPDVGIEAALRKPFHRICQRAVADVACPQVIGGQLRQQVGSVDQGLFTGLAQGRSQLAFKRVEQGPDGNAYKDEKSEKQPCADSHVQGLGQRKL